MNIIILLNINQIKENLTNLNFYFSFEICLLIFIQLSFINVRFIRIFRQYLLQTLKFLKKRILKYLLVDL